MMKRLYRLTVTLVLAAAFTVSSGAFAHAAWWAPRPSGTPVTTVVQKPGAAPASGEPDTGSSSVPAPPKTMLSPVGSGQGMLAQRWLQLWSSVWMNLYLWRTR